jgi:hypothetical protein
LSELITLAEVGLQVKEDEDDTSRLSELLALTSHMNKVEKDTFLSQAIEEVEAAYYR